MEKSVLEPRQSIIWLGFLWNLKKDKLEIPIEKINKIHFLLKNILENKYIISARKLSSVVGKIIALKHHSGIFVT